MNTSIPISIPIPTVPFTRRVALYSEIRELRCEGYSCHDTRSLWAAVWRRARTAQIPVSNLDLEGISGFQRAACLALNDRRWAEYKAVEWRLAKQDAPF